ncbi:hypothetical protein JOY44_10490 [Phormidium sp. CLA17]|uniref:hypothetical protein n=1 Tax=Leptolyngbya sp. Cla-17 TaxID=2803751 RepID=UPI001492016E|nr:hypothetical protein [Leptolyngbya sp. Cla-17]MBM0742042.1 hypothetical protein [Leptolyngbya sp. Cla-17]
MKLFTGMRADASLDGVKEPLQIPSPIQQRRLESPDKLISNLNLSRKPDGD